MLVSIFLFNAWYESLLLILVLFHYCTHLNQHDTNPWNARFKVEEKRTKCGVWLLLLKRGSCLCQTTREQINQKGASRFRHFVWERCCFFPILKSESDLISQQRSCMWHKSLERSMIPMPLCLRPLFCIWCHYVCLFCFVAGYHCTTTGPHQTHLQRFQVW